LSSHVTTLLCLQPFDELVIEKDKETVTKLVRKLEGVQSRLADESLNCTEVSYSCLCVCIYVSIHLVISVSVYIYVYTYIYTYVCIYTYMRTEPTHR